MLRETQVTYALNSTLTSQSFIAYNSDALNTPQPAIIIVPDWRGRSDFYCDIARKIAQLGYVGFAVDMYGDATLAQSNDDKKTLLEPLRQNRAELLARIQAAYQFICQAPYVDQHRIAGVGYCFGAMFVLDLARAGVDIKGAVSLHGLLSAPPGAQVSTIQSKILILHGYEDIYVKPQQVIDFADEMTRAKADWQIHMYGHTLHSFTKPSANDPAAGLQYDELANTRSWDAMQYFLKEIF